MSGQPPAHGQVNRLERGAPGSVLATAFEPFGGDQTNASAHLLAALAERDPRYQVHILPVVAGAAESGAKSAYQNGNGYRWAVSFGEAGPEPEVRLEWIAVNWDDFRIPDNAGNTIAGATIVPDGPAAWFSSFDLPAVERSLSGRTPLPVRLSLSAGNFLCNRLAYSLLNEKWPIPYAFVHVPRWRPDDGAALLNDLTETVRAVAESLENEVDKLPEGKLHR